MRLRILSSVLLPAPLRPMMPTTSPGCDLERDVLERPEVLSAASGDPPPEKSRLAPAAITSRSAT